MSNFSGPKALTEYVLYQSKHKANKSFYILLVQGILAGLYISIGAIGNLKLLATTTDPGLGAFLGALVFPVGIIAIILMQAELFTSDSMVMIAVYAGRTKFTKILRIILLIFFANLIGAIATAYMTCASGIFNDTVMQLVAQKALHKVNMPVGQLFVSAILCNIIVSTGVCLAYSCREEISKVVVVWLAITVFVLSGTEHVVANMYYLFLAYFGGAPISLIKIAYHLSVAGLGNFVGGGIVVSGINYLLAYKDIEHPKKS